MRRVVATDASGGQLGCTALLPPEGSFWTRATPAAGRWEPFTDSALVFADLELHLTRRPGATSHPGGYRRHRANSTGPCAGAVEAGGGGGWAGAIAGAAAGRSRRPSPAPLLLANIYTFLNRVGETSPIRPGRNSCNFNRNRWRQSDQPGRPV
jgi:hypothetical protein